MDVPTVRKMLHPACNLHQHSALHVELDRGASLVLLPNVSEQAAVLTERHDQNKRIAACNHPHQRYYVSVTSHLRHYKSFRRHLIPCPWFVGNVQHSLRCDQVAWCSTDRRLVQHSLPHGPKGTFPDRFYQSKMPPFDFAWGFRSTFRCAASNLYVPLAAFLQPADVLVKVNGLHLNAVDPKPVPCIQHRQNDYKRT